MFINSVRKWITIFIEGYFPLVGLFIATHIPDIPFRLCITKKFVSICCNFVYFVSDLFP